MTITILTGCALSLLATLSDQSVHTCVTSPPYWGLRDYGTAQWEGGDPNCSHRPDDTARARGIASSTLDGGKKHTGHKQEGFKHVCPRCGATRNDSQIGLESTPEDYVSSIVAVFREVRRVLRDDGTVWVNLGDSYAQTSYGTGGGWATNPEHYDRPTSQARSIFRDPGYDPLVKPKNLVGIPWRVAFALQADGWYLRSDIIWAKPNPMPESVTDRPTKSHEYLFLLSKSERYFYDQQAIAEPVTPSTIERLSQPTLLQQKGSHRVPGKTNGTMKAVGALDTRNRRTVWTVPTKPFSEAHFATYPAELVEPCILAGSPVGGTVLDPFFGAGTTGLVADRHGRHCIGVELNPDYVKIAEKRLRRDAGMFADIVVAA